MDLDERIKLVARYFPVDKVIIAGGLASYLNTGIVRDTDDVDLISMPGQELGDERYQFSTRTGIHVDITSPDYVFDSIDLSPEKLLHEAIKRKIYSEKEQVQYLVPEAMVASKLTSFCVSGEDGQPNQYGVKVLRDRDIQDIRNLLRCEFDDELAVQLFETVRQLDEVPDYINFWTFAKDILTDRSTEIPFQKSAFGVARYLSIIPEQYRSSELEELKQKATELQTEPFALYVHNEKLNLAHTFDE